MRRQLLSNILKPVTSLAGNNVFTHYKQSQNYNQISHALSNIYGLHGCSCNLLDVISVYSLNLDKLPGRFSYKWLGYEANELNAWVLISWCHMPFLLVLIRTLGTPDDSMWPGVTNLPDYKSSFPKWPKQKLQNVLKSMDPQGLDLLEVSRCCTQIAVGYYSSVLS